MRKPETSKLLFFSCHVCFLLLFKKLPPDVGNCFSLCFENSRKDCVLLLIEEWLFLLISLLKLVEHLIEHFPQSHSGSNQIIHVPYAG